MSLTYSEKQHIKDVLGEGLNINRNINFPYFLDAIENMNKKVNSLESTLRQIIYNQQILESKLNRIINSINNR